MSCWDSADLVVARQGGGPDSKAGGLFARFPRFAPHLATNSGALSLCVSLHFPKLTRGVSWTGLGSRLGSSSALTCTYVDVDMDSNLVTLSLVLYKQQIAKYTPVERGLV